MLKAPTVGTNTPRTNTVRLNDEQFAGAAPDPVSAYTWYLLAEKTTASILEQIELGKTKIRRAMSPEQQAEAEARAAAWLKNTQANGKKRSASTASRHLR